jgi:hypothetical protein
VLPNEALSHLRSSEQQTLMELQRLQLLQLALQTQLVLQMLMLMVQQIATLKVQVQHHRYLCLKIVTKQ